MCAVWIQTSLSAEMDVDELPVLVLSSLIAQRSNSNAFSSIRRRQGLLFYILSLIAAKPGRLVPTAVCFGPHGDAPYDSVRLDMETLKGFRLSLGLVSIPLPKHTLALHASQNVASH